MLLYQCETRETIEKQEQYMRNKNPQFANDFRVLFLMVQRLILVRERVNESHAAGA
jgi:hypothetical protein